ncbi:MAG: hypothetical protein AVDCRST_MAG02-3304, partial [uncultured Rubrobacteraceae bacterium]
ERARRHLPRAADGVGRRGRQPQAPPRVAERV